MNRKQLSDVALLHQRRATWDNARNSVRNAMQTGHFDIWVRNGHMRYGVSFRQSILDFHHWIATYVGWPDIEYRP